MYHKVTMIGKGTGGCQFCLLVSSSGTSISPRAQEGLRE